MDLLAAAAEVARFLEEKKIPYAVIGGLALQHWGEPRQTRDVDITVFVPPEMLETFLDQALKRFASRIPNAKTFALRHRVLLLEVGEVPVDLSLGIPGYEEEALARAVGVEFPNVGSLRLLGPEDLVIHKCVAGRPRDLEDVEGILIRQRLELDFAYIRRWLREFQEVVTDHDPLRCFEEALRRARKKLQKAG